MAIEEDILETKAEGENGAEQPLIQREHPWPGTPMAFIHKPYNCHSAASTPFLDVGWFVGITFGSTPHTRLALVSKVTARTKNAQAFHPLSLSSNTLR